MNLAYPTPGQGWDRLLMTPQFNGGDVLPEELRASIDSMLAQVFAVGLLADGTPSMMILFQTVYRDDGTAEKIVHWCNDGRTPLKQTFDLLDLLVALEPGTRFLAFCRRPALVRLLAARGWRLQSHEDAPFMALMTCQLTWGLRAQ